MSENYECESFEKTEVTEDFIKDKPWALKFLRKIQKSVKTAALTWLKYALEIDSTEEGNKDYITVFEKHVSELCEDMITDMAALHQKHIHRIGEYLNRLDYLDVQLESVKTSHLSLENSGMPLKNLETELKTKINEYEALLDAKQKKLASLNMKYASLAENIGKTPKRLSSGHTRMSFARFEQETERLETEVAERKVKHSEIVSKIEEISIETGIPFSDEFLRLSDKTTKITDDVLQALEKLHESMLTEKNTLLEKTRKLSNNLDRIWNLLCVSVEERERFVREAEGKNLQEQCAMLIKELEDLKSNKMEQIIEEQRESLNKLWDLCCCGPEVRSLFPQIHTQESNENIFNCFEEELVKWENYYHENIDILEAINNYSYLKNEILEHELNFNADVLYKNRGGTLLNELRTRKILSSRIKTTERKLLTLSKQYLESKGCPFIVFGQTIETFLHKQGVKEQELLILKRSNKNVNPCGSSSSLKSVSSWPGVQFSSQTKNKFKTPPNKAKNVKTSVKKKSTPNLPRFKLNQTKVQTPPYKMNWNPCKLTRKNTGKNKESDETWSTEYSDFEKDAKDIKRSTSFSEEKIKCNRECFE